LTTFWGEGGGVTKGRDRVVSRGPRVKERLDVRMGSKERNISGDRSGWEPLSAKNRQKSINANETKEKGHRRKTGEKRTTAENKWGKLSGTRP